MPLTVGLSKKEYIDLKRNGETIRLTFNKFSKNSPSLTIECDGGWSIERISGRRGTDRGFSKESNAGLGLSRVRQLANRRGKTAHKDVPPRDKKGPPKPDRKRGDGDRL